MTKILYILMAYFLIGIIIDAILRPNRSVTHITFFWLPVGLKLLSVFFIDVTRVRKLFLPKPKVVVLDSLFTNEIPR